MLTTCIATNVIFLQATHFVDIDSRDHFFSIPLGGPKLPFGVTVFHRESLSSSQESYFFGELPGAFVENKYGYQAEAGSRKPEADGYTPPKFFFSEFGVPLKNGEKKEGRRSDPASYWVFWVTFQGRSTVKLREGNRVVTVVFLRFLVQLVMKDKDK